MSRAAAMPLERRVFAELCCGKACSGESLATQLRVTRSAIWKAIEKLRELGLAIEASRPAGYRLPQPLSPLDAALITAALPAATRAAVQEVAVEWSLGSTNDALLSRRDQSPGRCEVLLAENQQAGRGRRARHWHSAPGASLCLSLKWQYPVLPANASALSLAMGVSALRALRSLFDLPLQLKWPNDLVSAGRKLGGVLIELRAEAAGPAYFVVGIGINVAIPTALRKQVQDSGTELVDLSELTGSVVDRNQLAAQLVAELTAGLREFGRSGLASFHQDWQRHDALAGAKVQISGAVGLSHGQAEGVDSDGALRVRTAAGVVRVTSGEVSVRAAA